MLLVVVQKAGYFDKVSRFIAEVPADKITVLTVKQPLEESDDPVWW